MTDRKMSPSAELRARLPSGKLVVDSTMRERWAEFQRVMNEKDQDVDVDVVKINSTREDPKPRPRRLKRRHTTILTTQDALRMLEAMDPTDTPAGWIRRVILQHLDRLDQEKSA